MFIQATDKKFYKNPVVYLRNNLIDPKYTPDVGAFIKVDDADEVVIYTTHDKKLLGKMLKGRGVVGRVSKVGVCDRTALPPLYSKMEPVRQYRITLNGPIPVPDESEWVQERMLGHDQTYLAWEMEFPLRHVKMLLEKPDRVCALATFLSGMSVGWNPRSVRGKIFNQYGYIQGMILEAESRDALDSETIVFTKKGKKHGKFSCGVE